MGTFDTAKHLVTGAEQAFETDTHTLPPAVPKVISTELLLPVAGRVTTLPPPLILAPAGADQVYETALSTGGIE